VLEILSIPLLGIVPESTDILAASNLGAPVTLHNPMSPAAKAYFEAARRLRGEQFEVVVPIVKKSFMDRLFGRRVA
jgi:septum site-determining protein MinD